MMGLYHGDWGVGEWQAMSAAMYARGDIDEDEFQRRRELLQSTRGVTR